MRGAFAVAGVCILVTATVALAQARRAPEAVRRAVAAELGSVRLHWLDPGDPRLATRPDADVLLSPIDVDGAAPIDWRADYRLAEGSQAWCGAGACHQQLWVSRRGGGHVLALDRQVDFMSLGERDGEHRVEFTVRGPECGGGADNLEPCRYAFAWDAAAGRLVERPTADGVTELWEGGLSLLRGRPSPPIVEQGFMRAYDQCETSMEPEWIPAIDVPDLNGDGRRDWISWTYDICAPGPGRVLAYVSDGDGWRQAYDSPARHFAVDIARQPAVLDVTEPCSTFRTPCAPTTLHWDPATGRLEG